MLLAVARVAEDLLLTKAGVVAWFRVRVRVRVKG